MNIPDISFPGLSPKTRHFTGHDDTFVNVDGIISIVRAIDTPEARKIYRSFRRRLVEVVHSHPELPAEKQREKAIFGAIEEAGWKLRFVEASEEAGS